MGKISINFRTGWVNYAFSGLIIAVRATHPGSEPLENWSVGSWLLMLAPVLYPLYLYVALWSAYLVGMVPVWIYDFFHGRIRR